MAVRISLSGARSLNEAGRWAMVNPLIRKLGSFTELSDEDRDQVNRLCAGSRFLPAGTTLIREGQRPEDVFLLIDGWACRQKFTADGQRQIMAFLVPGDLCDIHVFILREMDHSIQLLSDTTVVRVSRETMLALLRDRPTIAQALFWATLVDEAVLREWLVNIGQRTAYERLAHLFCELWMRLRQVGLLTGRKFFLPLTQEQLGDTVGLTAVHVNRMLTRMRADGLISTGSKQLEMLDVDRLIDVAGFDPKYLHLDRRGSRGPEVRHLSRGAA